MLEERYSQKVKLRPRPTFLIGIRNAEVAVVAIRHFPAPVLISRNEYSGPSVYPNIMLPDLSITNNSSYYRITAFMSTPDLVTRTCSLAPIWVEVAAHERTRSLPIGIKI